MSSPAPPPAYLSYITLTEAKEQLGIDEGLTIHDARITRMIGSAIDWAENFTGRSLGQLIELNSPADSPVTPQPDPVNSPSFSLAPFDAGTIEVQGWSAGWDELTWYNFWRNNPIDRPTARPLRRDVKEAILMRFELLFDRNVDNWELIEKATEQMLTPYRIGMGV